MLGKQKQPLPQWVSDLLTTVSSPNFKIDATTKFLLEHFTHQAEPLIYTFNHGDQTLKFNKDQMKQFMQLLSDYHYDGSLHVDNAGKRSNRFYRPYDRYDSFFEYAYGAYLHVRHPSMLGFQAVNTLEVLSLLTGIWIWKHDYEPGLGMAGLLGTVALFVMRNNYQYTYKGKTHEERQAILNKIDETYIHIEGKVSTNSQTAVDKEGIIKALVDKLVEPSFWDRFFQELCCWASILTKIFATFAVLSAELSETFPLAVIIFLSVFVLGLVEGADMAYTKVMIVAGEIRRMLSFLRGSLPPRNIRQQVLFFDKFADLSLIAWLMAKVGPLAWLAVKFQGLAKLIEILALGQAGVSKIVPFVFDILRAMRLPSVLMYCTVFSLFNVVKLGEELLTKRDFKLTRLNGDGDAVLYSALVAITALGFGLAKFTDMLFDGIGISYLVGIGSVISSFGGLIVNRVSGGMIKKLGPAFMSAIPAAMMAAVAFKKATHDNYVALAAGFLAISGMAACLGIRLPQLFKTEAGQDKFTDWYEYITKMRFVTKLNNVLCDELCMKDKAVMLGVSGVTSLVGYAALADPHDSWLMTISNGVLLMLLTGLMPKLRMFMQGLRFSFNQATFYCLAFFHGIINCLKPLWNMYHGLPAGNRSEEFLIKDFGRGWYHGLIAIGLGLGYLAGRGDWNATGSKVEEVTEAPNLNQFSVFARARESLTRCSAVATERIKAWQARRSGFTTV